MKKFQFLLLDAGPIIKLFELAIWDKFIERCDVTVSSTVAVEAKWASQEFEDICIDLDLYEKQNRIKIIDVGTDTAKRFYDKFDSLYKTIIHDGEKETLAFLCFASGTWQICSSDGAVFRILGLLGKCGQGVSLEELLKAIGLGGNLEWQFTKKFREKYTQAGRIDATQGQGLKK